MTAMTKCASCEGRLARTRIEEILEVANRRFVAKLPARVCRSCDKTYIDAKALERLELEVACELARRGPACGETFRYLRKALGMRALELAELLDLTAETVSRWENDQRSVDGPAWIALGSMVLEKARQSTSTLERLRALKAPATKSARPRPVRIVVAGSGRAG
ncbi:MAG: helix-turn-helix domain protein [Myxococcaceae bacterium]|nr:helix-turn-helix domain protein [Myxococcaceae bacterium]